MLSHLVNVSNEELRDHSLLAAESLVKLAQRHPGVSADAYLTISAAGLLTKKRTEMRADEHKIRIRLIGESIFDSGSTDIREFMKPLPVKIVDVFKNNKETLLLPGIPKTYL